MQTQHNDEQDDRDLDDHDGGVEARALLDPDHQDRGDHQCDQKAGRLKPISTPKRVRRSHHLVGALNQLRRLRADDVADFREKRCAFRQEGSERAPSAAPRYFPRSRSAVQ